jgi:outer membrane immunogenic protein
MKRLSFALLFSTAATGAFAADAVVYEPAPVDIAPVFIWTGGYVGLHAGYAWGRENDNQSVSFPPGGGGSGGGANILFADRFDVDGFIGGAHAGYNWQTGQWVFGVEADIDYADVSGGSDFIYYGGGVTGRLNFESDWQASLRLRAGYAVDTWLFYATGGVAVGHAELSASGFSFGSRPSTSDDNTHTGWTVGAGVEKAFTPNWIGRTEVRYTDFGKEGYNLGALGNNVDVDWHQTAVMAGISYKF